MKYILLISVFSLVLGFNSRGFAFPNDPACSRTYHYESYGFGFASGYANLAGRTDMNDEGCFRAGFADGQSVSALYAKNHFECNGAFNDGAIQGSNGEILTITTPSECSHGGYIWGQSYLSVSARNGRADLVGDECVAAYQAGLSDYRKSAAPSPTGSLRATYCYTQGYELMR